MTSIKILSVCLFVSCSCGKKEQGYSFIASGETANEPPHIFDNDSGSNALIPITTADSEAPQPFQDEKINGSITLDTNKTIRKHLKTNNKITIKLSVNDLPLMNVKSECYDLLSNPLTIQEAAGCSMYHWKSASDLLGRGEVDSALRHCRRALSLYENGSLFYLKAKSLNIMRRFSEALQASEISLDRTDHWRERDKEASKTERCIAIRSLYEKYPSSELLGKIDKYCRE